MANLRCFQCGVEFEAYKSGLHEELQVCGDGCGVERVDEKDQNYSRACRRLEKVRDTLEQLRTIDPAKNDRGYPQAFGSLEMGVKLALIEAGANQNGR